MSKNWYHYFWLWIWLIIRDNNYGLTNLVILAKTKNWWIKSKFGKFKTQTKAEW